MYVAAELEEPGIWAGIKEHDAVVFYDNDFEIFIDPDGDTHNYFEIEVNAVNTIFDLFMPKPYRNGGPALRNWDVQHLQSAVTTEGTVNNANDIDRKWFVEMAIPFRSLSLEHVVKVPKDQATWRINFSRVAWDTEIIKGLYVKQTDPGMHRPKPEHNWVWSLQGVVNMHLPERWGFLHFSTQKAGASNKDFPALPAEQVKKYLWLLYYKQQDYRRKHKEYATELSTMNIPGVVEAPGLHCTISLEATPSQYIAIAAAATGSEIWQITHEGKINKISAP